MAGLFVADRANSPRNPRSLAKRQRQRLHLEHLEERLVLNNRFVVPATTPIDNLTTFDTLQAALTTSGLSTNDIIQIEPGSVPGSIVNANLPELANLTIQGDATAGLTAIPQFSILDPITISTSQAGFAFEGVNVALTDAGSLTFDANASILGSTLTDSSSSALHALTFNGTADVLSNSTLVNDIALPMGSSLILVTPGAGGSNNLITRNLLVANAQSGALLIYQAAAATIITDSVTNNSFIGNPGSNVARLLVVGQQALGRTNSGQIAGLSILNNTFSDADNDVIAMQVNQAGAGTRISNNAINLTASSSLNEGIVIDASAADTTTSAVIAVNRINTNGFGTGLEIDLGSDQTSVANLQVQGNDFHSNAIGVLVRSASGASTATVAGIDLGGGSQGSLGGNNLRGFTAAAANFGAIVVSGVAAGQGTLSAQLDNFATGVNPRFVVFDPNTNLNVSSSLSANAALVDTFYEDLLGRAGNITNIADAGFWINALNSATLSQTTIANDILHSSEALGGLVDGLYVRLLHRAADAGGRAAFLGLLQGGASLEQVINMMVSSQEYANLTGPDGAFIQSLYDSLLGRSGSSAEVAFWLALLPSFGRAGVANAFLASSEFRADVVEQFYGFTQAPSATAASLFTSLLGRNASPSATEVASWVNSSGSVLAIELSFLASGEFFTGGPGTAHPPPVTVLNITSPTGGYVSGGLLVITGTGLSDVTKVTIGGEPAVFASASDNNTLRCEYFPTATPGPATVVLTTKAGFTTGATFTFLQSTSASPPVQTNLATSTWMPQALNAYPGWDGNIWWVSNEIPALDAPKVGDLWNSTLAGVVTEMNLPGTIGGQYAVNQVDFCAGPDGAMFSLSGKTDTILYRIALPAVPGQGITSVSLAAITAAGYLPRAMVVGPDGNLWVSFNGTSTGSMLVRVSPDLQTVTQFPIAGYAISGIIANKNGNLYAIASPLPTTGGYTHLLEINMSGVVVSDTSLPNATNLLNTFTATGTFAYGSDGFLYFTNGLGVLRVNPANLTETTQIPVTGQVSLVQIAAGTDGNLWVTVDNQELSADPGLDSGFAVITPAGSVTVTIVPGSAEDTDGQTFGITAAPDGNMYLPVNINRQAGAIGYVVKVSP